MFHSPRTMVKTRGFLRRERDQSDIDNQMEQLPNKSLELNTERKGQKNDEKLKFTRATFLDAGSAVKSEPTFKTAPLLPTASCHLSEKAKSIKTTSSSVAARRAKLELEAAEAKARIETELIEKRLAVELAALDEGCSIKSDKHTHSEVEKWLERSHQELTAQPAPDNGEISGAPCLPLVNRAGTEGETVRILASALKDLTTASANNGPNASLLSRICTPSDLPSFAGDPMEWLQFKQAYDESSQVCSFSPKENLWRLRKCLRGPAREAVSALLISATTPDMVMETLELQFGNPDVILSRIMLDINKLQPVSHDYHKDIVILRESSELRSCSQCDRS